MKRNSNHTGLSVPLQQDTEPFGQRLMALLPRLMQEIARYEENYLTQGKITQPQFLTLDYLCGHGPQPMKGLAEVMHLQCSSMTGLVDRLFRQKLVSRLHDAEDRRVVKVSATAKGKKIVQEIRSQKIKGLTELFSKVSAVERQTYLEIIEKIFHRLSSCGEKRRGRG